MGYDISRRRCFRVGCRGQCVDGMVFLWGIVKFGVCCFRGMVFVGWEWELGEWLLGGCECWLWDCCGEV